MRLRLLDILKVLFLEVALRCLCLCHGCWLLHLNLVLLLTMLITVQGLKVDVSRYHLLGLSRHFGCLWSCAKLCLYVLIPLKFEWLLLLYSNLTTKDGLIPNVDMQGVTGDG